MLVSLNSSALAATPVQPTSLKDDQRESQVISYRSWKNASEKIVNDYLGGPNPEGCQRASQAMLQMRKIDLATVKRAYEGV